MPKFDDEAPTSKTARKTTKKAAKKVVDDLTEITGIGPKMKAELKKIGITAFKQLAVMKAADVNELAEKISTNAARIKREKWVTSAKACHREKYGERV